MRRTLALFVAAGALLLWALALGRSDGPPAASPLGAGAPAPDGHRVAFSGPGFEVEGHARPVEGSSARVRAKLRFSPRPDAPVDPAPRALVLVLDRSGSMSGAALEAARDAALETARSLGPRDRLAVVSYGSEARVDLPLSTVTGRTPTVRAALLDLEAGGGSHLSAGLALARRVLVDAPPGAQSQVLLLTDGEPNQGLTDPAALEALARDIRDRGVQLSAVGLGDAADPETLRRLADAGGGRVHSAPGPESLRRIFAAELRREARPRLHDAWLELAPGPGVELRRIWGVDTARRGDRHHLELGDLARGEDRAFMLDLEREVGPLSSGPLLRIVAGHRSGRSAGQLGAPHLAPTSAPLRAE
jgi:Ca-activated chloride channel family protein